MTFLLITDEIAQVFSTVAVRELPMAMHLVLQEAAHVMAAVRPGVRALTLHHVLLEGPLVARSIEHDKLALPMPIAIPILTLKAPIIPDLHTVSVLFVSSPLTLVRGLVTPDKLAMPAPLVVFKVSNIVAAIWIDNAP